MPNENKYLVQKRVKSFHLEYTYIYFIHLYRKIVLSKIKTLIVKHTRVCVALITIIIDVFKR